MDEFVHYCSEIEMDNGKIDLLDSNKKRMFLALNYWSKSFMDILNLYIKGSQLIPEESFIREMKGITFMYCYTYISMRKQGYMPEDDTHYSLEVIRCFIILKFYFSE